MVKDRELMYALVQKELDHAKNLNSFERAFLQEDLANCYEELKCKADEVFVKKLMFYSKLIHDLNNKGE